MSSGTFVLSKYEADSGDIHPIRVQPETAAATLAGGANSAPSGSITDGAGQVRARGSRRAIGKKARSCSFVWTDEPPEDYKEGGGGTIPVLTTARYEAINIGSTGTYLGSAITIVGKQPEGGR